MSRITYHVSRIKQHTDDRRGIALLLTVILLGGLVLIAFAASSLVTAFGQTPKVLGNSEKAYYAAEAALERSLYEIEKQGAGLVDITGSGNLGGTAVTWSRKAFVTAKIPLGRNDVRPNTPNNPVVSGTNPLLVTLQPGESFQLDLNIVGAVDPSYPQHVNISGSSSFSYIILENGVQVGPTTDTNQNVPATGNLDPSTGLRFKITNPSGFASTYTITPNGSNELPVALVVSATGVSGTEERTIEVERKAWLVY